SFKLDAERYLVNADGLRLEDIDPLPEGAYDLVISPEGEISYKDADGATVNTGQIIQLYNFANPAGLAKYGRNLLVETEASGEAIGGDPGLEGRGTLAQRYLESANVQVVEEMVAMITAQRAYEVNTKAIQTTDEMMGQANNLKR
ncbi:MAG: flagellar hook-basal body complex protein, partial [Heliobacteriaceae bacterium]|nr:flagellar hook-basal body complex protein [Heliobacteriaceae bacterium]